MDFFSVRPERNVDIELELYDNPNKCPYEEWKGVDCSPFHQRGLGAKPLVIIFSAIMSNAWH